MSYVENNLLPNEIINYEWKVHSFYTIIMVIWIFFGVIFLIWWIQAWWPMWIIGFWMLSAFLYQLLFILTTEIVVTNKRVLYKTGVIARNVFELQLNKVESARLNQTVFQRIIWAWTLIVSWTWWHNKPMEYLSKPTEMRTIIYEIIEND